MPISRHTPATALAFLMVGSVVLDAQTATRARLATAKTVTCTFTVSATGTWKNGTAEGELKPGTLSVQFIEVNADEGTARLVSGFGNYDIIVRLAQGFLHFVQSFRDGPLYTTTIFDQESRAGKLKAVHTRHDYSEISLPGFTSRPQQYYGDCEAAE